MDNSSSRINYKKRFGSNVDQILEDRRCRALLLLDIHLQGSTLLAILLFRHKAVIGVVCLFILQVGNDNFKVILGVGF